VIRDLGINPAGLNTLAEFGVKANGTGLDFKLKVKPGASSSLNAGIELVAADLLAQLTDPSGRRPGTPATGMCSSPRSRTRSRSPPRTCAAPSRIACCRPRVASNQIGPSSPGTAVSWLSIAVSASTTSRRRCAIDAPGGVRACAARAAPPPPTRAGLARTHPVALREAKHLGIRRIQDHRREPEQRFGQRTRPALLLRRVGEAGAEALVAERVASQERPIHVQPAHDRQHLRPITVQRQQHHRLVRGMDANSPGQVQRLVGCGIAEQPRIPAQPGCGAHEPLLQ